MADFYKKLKNNMNNISLSLFFFYLFGADWKPN